VTAADFESFVKVARDNRVQEFSVGDVHVLMSSAAFSVQQPYEPELSEPSRDPVDPGLVAHKPLSDDEAAKLMDDPDLFLHADGGPAVPA
jgi:hypothetical protein